MATVLNGAGMRSFGARNLLKGPNKLGTPVNGPNKLGTPGIKA